MRGPGFGDDPPTARNPPNSLSSVPAKIFTFNPVPFAKSSACLPIHAGVLIFAGV